MTLTEFLLARIAEDKEIALAASVMRYGEDVGWDGHVICAERDSSPAQDEHVLRWDPARVLAECEAKRRLIERVGNPDWAGFRFLALPHADHPDYLAEWRP